MLASSFLSFDRVSNGDVSVDRRKERGSLTDKGAKKPNVLILWGDDIGWYNISHNNRGAMGYKTPNIDRIAKEGVEFTDYYG